MSEDLVLHLDTGQNEENLIVNHGQADDDVLIELDIGQHSEEDDVVLSLDAGSDINLMLGSTADIEIRTDNAVIVATDYNRLVNKPRINTVELRGNKYLHELFPEGIVIDGGNASTNV